MLVAIVYHVKAAELVFTCFSDAHKQIFKSLKQLQPKLLFLYLQGLEEYFSQKRDEEIDEESKKELKKAEEGKLPDEIIEENEPIKTGPSKDDLLGQEEVQTFFK